MRAWLTLLLLLAATPAATQTVTPSPAQQATAERAAAASPIRPLRRPGEDDALVPSTLRRLPVTATPRFGRGFDDAAFECRRACAPARYQCGLRDEPTVCAAQWTTCQASCSTFTQRR